MWSMTTRTAALGYDWHLFLSTPEPDLSRGMHDLNSGYATLYNRRHRRFGALFQGRFKSILVQDEGYGWTLSRYVHLNPVRAGAAQRPHQYRWSSYRDYLDPKHAPSWLDWQTVLGEIGTNLKQSRSEYTRFVEAGVGAKLDSPLAGVVGGVLLGAASWVERMKEQIASHPGPPEVPARRRLVKRPLLVEVEAAVCDAWGVAVEDVRRVRRHGNEARVAALHGLTHGLGDCGGRDGERRWERRWGQGEAMGSGLDFYLFSGSEQNTLQLA